MIALLKGRVEAYEDDGVILDVGGVGYHVVCSSRTLAALPRVGEVGKLFTEMLVSENKDKAPGLQLADPALARIEGAVPAVPPRALSDAVSALVNLGYGQAQA